MTCKPRLSNPNVASSSLAAPANPVTPSPSTDHFASIGLAPSPIYPHASDCAIWVSEPCDCVIGKDLEPSPHPPPLSPEAAEIVSVLVEPSPKQTDIAKLQAAMNAKDVSAIGEALFGKPTGIKRVDRAIASIMADVESLQNLCACGEHVDLMRCKDCYSYVCADCRRYYHTHQGPDAGRGRF